MSMRQIDEKLKSNPGTSQETAKSWLVVLEDNLLVSSKIVSAHGGTGAVRVFILTELGEASAKETISILVPIMPRPVMFSKS